MFGYEPSKAPPLPVTVPTPLHEAMREACGEPFALSYLSGARCVDKRLTPRTSIAYRRLRANKHAMAVLLKLGLVLIEPEPYHLRHGVPL